MLRLLFIGILASIYIAHIQATDDDKSVNDLINDKLTQFTTSDSDSLQDLLSILDDDRRALSLWKIYKNYLQKTYSSPKEDKERMIKFINNLRKILTANDNFRRGLQSYSLEMNSFGDMDEKEFLATHTGVNLPTNYVYNEVNEQPDYTPGVTEKPDFIEGTTRRPHIGAAKADAPGMSFDPSPTNKSKKPNRNHEDPAFTRKKRALDIPDRLDYRPLLPPVENQGDCRSCYAFAVGGTIEGAYAVQRKQHLRLSKQQILDCGPRDGCDGGWPADQFTYIKNSRGLLLQSVYPYHASRGACAANRLAPGRIRSYGNITSEDENDMKVHLLIYGPLSIVLDAHQFQFLASNPKSVLDVPNCNQLNHAVVIVGYGTTNGRDYWLVRNSWGPDWADRGYFKLARNRNGMCGLTRHVQYVLI